MKNFELKVVCKGELVTSRFFPAHWYEFQGLRLDHMAKSASNKVSQFMFRGSVGKQAKSHTYSGYLKTMKSKWASYFFYLKRTDDCPNPKYLASQELFLQFWFDGRPMFNGKLDQKLEIGSNFDKFFTIEFETLMDSLSEDFESQMRLNTQDINAKKSMIVSYMTDPDKVEIDIEGNPKVVMTAWERRFKKLERLRSNELEPLYAKVWSGQPLDKADLGNLYYSAKKEEAK